MGPIKKHQIFFSPGSLSTYRDLRRKQQENMSRGKEREMTCDFPVASVQHKTVAANVGGFSLRVQQDKPCTTIEVRDNVEDEEAHGIPSPGLAESTNADKKTKKYRGPTKLVDVHARTIDERQFIILNSCGQPVGPTEKIVLEFSRFLGTIAKNPELALLNYIDWLSLNTHEQIWEYVLEKYMVPENGKKWVMETINDSWRIYKSRMKKKHFYAYETDEFRWKNRPHTIPELQFKDLLNYWNTTSIENESKMKKIIRQNLDDMHTLGPKSYALLRHKLQQEDPNKEEPSQAKIYKESRRRNPEKTYKTSYLTSKDNIDQMNALQSREHGRTLDTDPYYKVVKKPEHRGRVRLYGKGVTKTDLKKKGNNPSFIFPQEFLQSIQSQIVAQLIQANPGLNLVIPQIPGAPTANSQQIGSNGGESSVPKDPSNEVHGETNRDEQESSE